MQQMLTAYSRSLWYAVNPWVPSFCYMMVCRRISHCRPYNRTCCHNHVLVCRPSFLQVRLPAHFRPALQQDAALGNEVPNHVYLRYHGPISVDNALRCSLPIRPALQKALRYGCVQQCRQKFFGVHPYRQSPDPTATRPHAAFLSAIPITHKHA